MRPRQIAEGLPVILWRCPACRQEDALEAGRAKKGILSAKPVVGCRFCGARWEDFSEQSMAMVEGPPDLLGRRSWEDWFELAGSTVEVTPRDDIATPVILKKGEPAVDRPPRDGYDPACSPTVGVPRLWVDSRPHPW